MAHDDRSASGDRDTRGLVALGEMPGVRIAPDEPDLRGWEVVSAADREVRLGTVAELLVDPAAAEIVALVVAPGDRESAAGRDALVVATDDVLIDRQRGVVLAERAEPMRPSRIVESRDLAEPGESPPRGDPGVRVHRTPDEEVVEVPVVEERLVVERRPVVTEYVVIRKRRTPETHIVDADLLRERVDVKETRRRE